MREKLQRPPQDLVKTLLRKGVVPTVAAILSLTAAACGSATINADRVEFRGGATPIISATATPRPSEAAGTPSPTETPIIIPGPEGKPGQNGKSAYEVAVANGFKGNEKQWLESLKGAKGETGAQGPRGFTGQEGLTGEKGEKGDTGPQGAVGPQGSKGEKGDKGDLTTVVTTPTPTPTPKPTRTPTPRPTETPKPTATPEFTFTRLNPDSAVFAQSGDIVKGDGIINSQIVHDQDPRTGLLTILLTDAQVNSHQEFGLDILHLNLSADLNSIIQKQIQEMLKSGCLSGCDKVDVIFFPGQTQIRIPAVPIPVPTPREIRPPFVPVHLERNFEIDAPRGSIVIGDVSVNGRFIADNDSETGLVVVLNKEARIRAPFGADLLIIDPNDEVTRQQLINQKVAEMRQSGCESGCDRGVTVIFFSGEDNPQHQ